MDNKEKTLNKIDNSYINALSYICILILFFCGQFAFLSFLIPLIIKIIIPEKYKTKEFTRNIKESFNYITTLAIVLITFIVLSILLLLAFILISIQESFLILILTIIMLTLFTIVCFILITFYYFIILVIAICKTINNEKNSFPLIIHFLK